MNGLYLLTLDLGHFKSFPFLLIVILEYTLVKKYICINIGE